MKLMAKAQTNGKIEKLSPERLAELLVPATAKTPEEKEAAFKRAPPRVSASTSASLAICTAPGRAR